MMMMMFNASEDICMSIGVMASYCFFDDMFSVSECRFLFQIRFFNLQFSVGVFPVADLCLVNHVEDLELSKQLYYVKRGAIGLYMANLGITIDRLIYQWR